MKNANAVLNRLRAELESSRKDLEWIQRDRNEMRKSAYNEQRRAESAEQKVDALIAAVEEHERLMLENHPNGEGLPSQDRDLYDRVRAIKSGRSTGKHSKDFQVAESGRSESRYKEIEEVAHDSRNSDEFVGNLFRASLRESGRSEDDPKECPACGSYLRGCRDCGAEYAEDGGCGSCLGLLPSRESGRSEDDNG